MIETLFGYSAGKQKNGDEKKPAAIDTSPQHIQILDPKKSQNLAILLRALNVTVEEVRDALIEGEMKKTTLLRLHFHLEMINVNQCGSSGSRG